MPENAASAYFAFVSLYIRMAYPLARGVSNRRGMLEGGEHLADHPGSGLGIEVLDGSISTERALGRSKPGPRFPLAAVEGLDGQAVHVLETPDPVGLRRVEAAGRAAAQERACRDAEGPREVVDGEAERGRELLEV